MAILFVTHFLDQVYAISDRITVLRNGKLVGEHFTADLDQSALVSAMVGRAFSADKAGGATSEAAAGEVMLQVRNLKRRGAVSGVNFELRRGEILGLAGLLGSGRTEVARLLFGLDRADAGEVLINGESVTLRDPAQAIAHGLAFCPEERKTEGIVEDLSIRDNMILTMQARMGLWRKAHPSLRRKITDRLAQLIDIRAQDLDAPIGTLSGGNQQKCVIARALVLNPRVLILDEPTRGIDVAAKQEIMNRLQELAREGLAIVFISAEMDELTRVSTRIVVMRDRTQAGVLPGGASSDDVYSLIAQAPAERAS
jgi:monosaccharide-transporting ATPase